MENVQDNLRSPFMGFADVKKRVKRSRWGADLDPEILDQEEPEKNAQQDAHDQKAEGNTSGILPVDAIVGNAKPGKLLRRKSRWSNESEQVHPDSAWQSYMASAISSNVGHLIQ